MYDVYMEIAAKFAKIKPIFLHFKPFALPHSRKKAWRVYYGCKAESLVYISKRFSYWLMVSPDVTFQVKSNGIFHRKDAS